jgi:hypothetical protein
MDGSSSDQVETPRGCSGMMAPTLPSERTVTHNPFNSHAAGVGCCTKSATGDCVLSSVTTDEQRLGPYTLCVTVYVFPGSAEKLTKFVQVYQVQELVSPDIDTALLVVP